MTDTGYMYEATDGVPIKHWTRGAYCDKHADRCYERVPPRCSSRTPAA